MLMSISSGVNDAEINVDPDADTEIPQRRVRSRQLSPRRPDPYDNEIHGRDRPSDWAEFSTDPDDWRDSYAIVRDNETYDIPPAVDRWFESDAARRLAELPKHQRWVPVWVARAAGHPARAILLSWLLSLFSEGRGADDNGKTVCRARAIDLTGTRWWRTTRRQLLEETLLEEAAADRARYALVKRRLIECDSRSDGLLVRPLLRGLAEEFHRLTEDDEVLDELKHLTAQEEWFGSHTRVRAEAALHGTAVHDVIMIICEHHPGPALVLSHVLHWHGLTSDGKSRARITRQGQLWMARSGRQLALNPGGDAAAMARHVRWLAQHSLVVAEPRRWRWLSARDRGRPTLHLRPDPHGIAAALTCRAKEIDQWIARRSAHLKPTKRESDDQTQELSSQDQHQIIEETGDD